MEYQQVLLIAYGAEFLQSATLWCMVTSTSPTFPFVLDPSGFLLCSNSIKLRTTVKVVILGCCAVRTVGLKMFPLRACRLIFL